MVRQAVALLLQHKDSAVLRNLYDGQFLPAGLKQKMSLFCLKCQV
ncbi:hypothetical protein ACI1P2_29035 [Paenibacillus sp. p-8]